MGSKVHRGGCSYTASHAEGSPSAHSSPPVCRRGKADNGLLVAAFWGQMQPSLRGEMGEERRASPPWDAGLWGCASQNHPKERGTAAFTISFLLPPDFQFLSFSLGIPIQCKGLAPLKIPEAAWAAQAKLRAHSLLLGKGSPLGALQSHPSPLESPSFWVSFLVAKLNFCFILVARQLAPFKSPCYTLSDYNTHWKSGHMVLCTPWQEGSPHAISPQAPEGWQVIWGKQQSPGACHTLSYGHETLPWLPEVQT